MSYNSKTKHFRLLEDKLKGKVASLTKADENHELHFKRTLGDEKSKHVVKLEAALGSLIKNVEKLAELYQKNDDPLRSDKSHPFLYKQQIDEVQLEEESFTNSLALYTKKQFFEGIAELAGSKDQTKYDFLDTSKPETLLFKGERDEIKAKDKQELKRLQIQYQESEIKRLKSEMTLENLKRKIKIAESQVKSLNLGYSTVDADINKNKKLTVMNEKNRKALQDDLDEQMIPLLNELQQLHGIKVLEGNYDLKIFRQDYFLSKQSEVINQLLLQCSRNYFLTMMYEIELKEHRKIYHLIESSRTLLASEIKKISSRIALLQDPVLQTNNLNKETISSKDEFMNRLYDVLVPVEERDENELYRTYSSLIDRSQILSSQLNNLSHKCKDLETQKDKHFDTLESSIITIQKLVGYQEAGLQSQMEDMVGHLEQDLTLAEVQVNDIIKDVMAKKKLLATDSLKELERSVFPNFFNDPARLKRTMTEIQSRVQAS